MQAWRCLYPQHLVRSRKNNYQIKNAQVRLTDTFGIAPRPYNCTAQVRAVQYEVVGMSLITITTCTDRKRFPVPAALDAAQLPPASQATLAGQWRRRILAAKAVGPAKTVYCGRSFQEAV